MEQINPTIIYALVKMGLMVISISIFMYNLCNAIKLANSANEFKGYIVKGFFHDYYECPACRKDVNIKKDKKCKNCGADLF